MAFGVDARADQLEVEGAGVAGGEQRVEQAFERDVAITGHRARGQRPVAIDVVGDLNEVAAWHGAFDCLAQAGLGPAGEQVDADAEPGHFCEGDGVGQGVGEVAVGVHRRGGLDHQFEAGCPGLGGAGGDGLAEHGGGFLPCHGAVAAAHHVDRVAAECGDGFDDLAQFGLLGGLCLRRRVERTAGEEQVGHALEAVGALGDDGAGLVEIGRQQVAHEGDAAGLQHAPVDGHRREVGAGEAQRVDADPFVHAGYVLCSISMPKRWR